MKAVEGAGGKRLRVVMSSFACEPGRGSEQEVGWRWANEMARHVDVTVLTQTRNRPGIEKWIEKEMPGGIDFKIEYLQFANPIYRLKSRFDCLTFPYYAAWQWLVLRRAKELHRENPFDIAHHVTFVTFRVPILLRYLGVPVVFGPVGGAETASWKLLAHRIAIGPWIKEAVRNLATKIGVGVLRLFRPIPGRSGICLAATPGMERVFQSIDLPSKLFPAIGVDLDEAPSEPPEKFARRFLFVGRLHPLKGVHLLIEAFARMDVPDSKLTIIGAGGTESMLRSLAQEMGVAERISWLGKLPRAELADHYRSHDVLVAPSLYESGGLAVLEAMQQSRPAVVIAVGGHDLSVVEGCGFKVDPTGTADEIVDLLSAAMREYATTQGLAESHGLAARRRLEDSYSWPRKSERMLAIYNSQLSATKENH